MYFPALVLALFAPVEIADTTTIPHWGSASILGARGTDQVKRDDGKYFHEPGGSELGNHYDSRYYQAILTYEEKQETQLHMIRAYLTFFAEKGVETWLAHGTLLGWWWNGKVGHQ